MDESTPSLSQKKRAKFRRVGLVVGVLGACLDAGIIFAFAEFGVLGLTVPLVVLGGILLLAWEMPLPGGIMLIVASLPTVPPFGLPLLVAGILFLLAWKEGRAR